VSESGQPGPSTVISSASDQPALNRIRGPGMGSGILEIFCLFPQSVVSKRGLLQSGFSILGSQLGL
jgi:hypothetical protein